MEELAQRQSLGHFYVPPPMSEPLPQSESPEAPQPAAWEPPSLGAMGAQLPQYEFVGVLGRGGMGVVYQARQITLDRFVAIKVLPPGVEDDELKFRERFITEARSMARLSHPSIVHVHDFGATPEGLMYFVMEFVEGTNVEDVLADKGCIPPKLAVHLIGQVCDALAYAHEHNLIHRDVKPSNILVDKEGRVKVADFGLAQEGVGLDTGPAMGTPEYAAPELTRVGVQIDHRVDLYALGVMLYQMLTGDVPRGEFLPVAMVKPDVNRRFDKVILKAMAWDMHQRYNSAKDIKVDLEAALAPEGSVAAGNSKDKKKKDLPPFQSASTRKRGAPAIVVFAPWVIVAALVALAFGLIRRNEEGPPPDVDPSAAPPVFGSAPIQTLPSGDPKKPAEEPAETPPVKSDKPAVSKPTVASKGGTPPATPDSNAKAKTNPKPEVVAAVEGEMPPDEFWKAQPGGKMPGPESTPDAAMAVDKPAKTSKPASAPEAEPANTTELPPVSDLVKLRVAELQKEFDKDRETMLNEAYYPRSSKLKEQYESALSRVLSSPKISNNASASKAIQLELQILADDREVPQQDGSDTPPELQELRSVYRAERNAIRDSLPGLLHPLYKGYIEKLEKLHRDLVQVGRAGDARHVETTLNDVRSAQASLES